MADELSVRVTHRGREHVVRVPADATVADLGIELERATGASVATQKVLGLKLAKLILKGGTLTPSKAEDAVLAVSAIPGMCDSVKPYMLMGSAAAEVAALDAAAQVDHRVRGFEQEDLRNRRRRRGHVSRTTTGGRSDNVGPPSTATHPYTFLEYRALPVPDVVTPPASAALKLLHRLASDPGILGVMAKHKWKVPLLAEMPPEGKVGVSESCVLGYNVNQGQEIHLRLRTDDMRGFRVYARIRETLIHELTHNVIRPHDIHFKRLCSQLNVECREFDWKRNGAGAQKLGGTADESDDEETWSEDEAMAATRASSGSRLGGEGWCRENLSPAEAAASAAAARAADAAEREMESMARDALDRADAGMACLCGACGAGPFRLPPACSTDQDA